MNKNLLVYMTFSFPEFPDFSEDKVEFESEEDARDWFIYHITELHRFVLYYLYHNVKNNDFCIYADKKKNFVTNEIVSYFKSQGKRSSKMIQEMAVLIEKIMSDFVTLRNMI